MSEEQIIRAIANACQDRTLYFQIIIQDCALHVYINRQNDSLNYQAITAKICAAVTSLKWLKVDEIYLYSRILGEVEYDWHTCIEIKERGEAVIDSIGYLAQEIETEVQITGSLIERLENESKIPRSLVRKVVDEIKGTRDLAAELKDWVETKAFDTLSEELAEIPTGELKNETVKNNSKGIDLSKSTTITKHNVNQPKQSLNLSVIIGCILASAIVLLVIYSVSQISGIHLVKMGHGYTKSTHFAIGVNS